MSSPIEPGRAREEPYHLEEPDRSTGELIGRLTSEMGELVRTHIELAKVEITQEVRQAGKGAGLLSSGAAAGLLALAFLSAAAAWGLAEVLPEGFAFLIVGAVWAIAAAVLLAAGRKEVVDIRPPQATVDEIKEDREWLSAQRS